MVSEQKTSLEESIQHLYEEFHQNHKKAQKRETQVKEQLVEYGLILDAIESYLTQIVQDQEDQTPLDPKQTLIELLGIFPNLAELIPDGEEDNFDPSNFKDLKDEYLHTRRVELLAPELEAMRQSIGRIKETLDSYLEENVVDLTLTVKDSGFKDNKYNPYLTVCYSPDDALDILLLTYILTGKVPSGFHIIHKGKSKPLPYSQLLADAFGGRKLTERDIFFNPDYNSLWKDSTFQIDIFPDDKSFGYPVITYKDHLTGENQVISNDGNIPIGLTEIGEEYYNKIFLLAIGQISDPSDRKKEYGLVLALNTPAGHRKNYDRDQQPPHSNSVKAVLTPNDFGEYVAKYLRQHHNDGRINLKIKIAK